MRVHFSFLSYIIGITLLFHISLSPSQTQLSTINQESLDNLASSYNYTYWNNNWKTTSNERGFSNHTSSYAFDIDYSNLSVNSLLIGQSPSNKQTAYKASHYTIFPHSYAGDIQYAILQDGTAIHEKSNNPTSFGGSDSQLGMFGVWYNNRFVSTNFTNSPAVDAYHTGIEFSTWHDRFKLSFHVKPTSDIANGQLELSFEMPNEYTELLNNGTIYGFGVSTDQGFAVKAGSHGESITVENNNIRVRSSMENLVANQSYQVSIIFYALTENFTTDYATVFEQESEISITGIQTLPYSSIITDDVSYDANEGTHLIQLPRYVMGQYDCRKVARLQSIDFNLINNSNTDKKVRLCFRQDPNINVTGFNTLLCNQNGDPSGFSIQVSKNWHTGTSQFHSGSWIREYTELIIPANTTLNLVYKRTGAMWGETYTASSHQLSVAGVGIPRGSWLEAALGSFGENVTHSPDYEFGNSNGADLRPFLVTNHAYGGTSSECNWTGNVGGIDFWVYQNSSNKRIYQSQVKTDFKKYSPNLTETSVSAYSSDQKLKLDYTFYLTRSDDFTRVYYNVSIEALEDVGFNRFDIFQLGGDIYNIHNTQSVVYGNDDGMQGQFLPTNNGSNDYTTTATALTGTNPWLWAGDGLAYTGATSGIDINTNNGMIIRSYQATFDGIENNTPYFRERSSSIGFSANKGTKPTSYCLVPPPNVSSFKAGDKIDLLVEVAVLPKQATDYYGANVNFANALAQYGNSYELLYRESLGNRIMASSPSNQLDDSFPLTVSTNNNTALVKITGGRGYVPVVFTGLNNITSPKLWKAEGSCWEIVDQSNHGKDFWQVAYNTNTGLYDIIYNVNQDIENDETAEIFYYLGEIPPSPSLISQTQIIGNPWSVATELDVRVTADSVLFAPQVNDLGIVTMATDGQYQWSANQTPIQNSRVKMFYPVTATDFQRYQCIYTSETGCTDTLDFALRQNTSCNSSSPIATAEGAHLATQSFFHTNDYTYYCNDDGELLLGTALEENLLVNGRELKLLIQTPTYVYHPTATAFIGNQDGGVEIRRKWKVEANDVETNQTNIHYFLPKNNLDSINKIFTAASLSPLADEEKIAFFSMSEKDYTTQAFESLKEEDIQLITHGDITDVSTYTLETLVDKRYVSFSVPISSSGGSIASADLITDTDEQISQTKSRIYPTLAAEALTLQIASENVGGTYYVFDLKGGEALMSGQCTSITQRIPLTSLSSGTYILKLANKTYKFIKK